MTDGKAEQIRNRYASVDSRSRYINLDEPIYVQRFGEWSKKSGHSKLVGSSLNHIYWGDARVGRITMANDKEVAAFTIEKHNDSPDLFISRDGSPNIQQVSKINPFENEFKIGKAELIEFTNANGIKLQGTLYYPDDYTPGKKYPMITYIYEKLSDGFHSYNVPIQNELLQPKSFYQQRIFFLQSRYCF